MGTIRIADEADQFRIEIEGRFGSDLVPEAETRWKRALREKGGRTFTVDISQLSGYDAAGLKLLRDMYRHGMLVAARTPRALVFLDEISSREPVGPTLVYSVEELKPQIGRRRASSRPAQRAAASGE